jgi:hypothetical protein
VDYTKFWACCGFRVPLVKHLYVFRMCEQMDALPQRYPAAARSHTRAFGSDPSRIYDFRYRAEPEKVSRFTRRVFLI